MSAGADSGWGSRQSIRNPSGAVGQKRRRVLLLALPTSLLGGQEAADFRVTATTWRVLNLTVRLRPFCLSCNSQARLPALRYEPRLSLFGVLPRICCHVFPHSNYKGGERRSANFQPLRFRRTAQRGIRQDVEQWRGFRMNLHQPSMGPLQESGGNRVIQKCQERIPIAQHIQQTE